MCYTKIVDTLANVCQLRKPKLGYRMVCVCMVNMVGPCVSLGPTVDVVVLGCNVHIKVVSHQSV